MKNLFYFLLALITSGCLLGSCKDYYDDLQGLGKRVEILEDSDLLQLDANMKILQHLVTVAENLNYITKIEENEDGSFTIVFHLEPEKEYIVRSGDKGANGDNGTEVKVGVVQDADGNWYWTINGAKTNMPVEAVDGKDGTDGNDGLDRAKENTTIPLFRVNEDGNWEYSLDNGKTWSLYLDDYGKPVAANGKNGAQDKYFKSVTISPDRTYVIFEQWDGTTFEVPISSTSMTAPYS
jgi:hypothetical protein